MWGIDMVNQNLNQNKMKVTTTEKGVIQLEEVFNGIILKTPAGEEMSICMRDSGFEFNYQGELYFAKQGFVEPFNKSSRGNYLVDQPALGLWSGAEFKTQKMTYDQPCQIDCRVTSCKFYKGAGNCENVSPAITLNENGKFVCWSKADR